MDEDKESQTPVRSFFFPTDEEVEAAVATAVAIDEMEREKALAAEDWKC